MKKILQYILFKSKTIENCTSWEDKTFTCSQTCTYSQNKKYKSGNKSVSMQNNNLSCVNSKFDIKLFWSTKINCIHGRTTEKNQNMSIEKSAKEAKSH